MVKCDFITLQSYKFSCYAKHNQITLFYTRAPPPTIKALVSIKFSKTFTNDFVREMSFMACNRVSLETRFEAINICLPAGSHLKLENFSETADALLNFILSFYFFVFWMIDLNPSFRESWGSDLTLLRLITRFDCRNERLNASWILTLASNVTIVELWCGLISM